MTPRDRRQVMDQMDIGRRAATLVLQRLDLGLDPAAVIREIAPTLSPIAVESAVRLAGLASFDFALLSIVLTGLADDSLLETAGIPEPPARRERPAPDDVADQWLLGPLLAPTPEPEGDRG